MEIFFQKKKTEHVQISKPWAEIINQQDCYSMEWNYIFYNLCIVSVLREKTEEKYLP